MDLQTNIDSTVGYCPPQAYFAPILLQILIFENVSLKAIKLTTKSIVIIMITIELHTSSDSFDFAVIVTVSTSTLKGGRNSEQVTSFS